MEDTRRLRPLSTHTRDGMKGVLPALSETLREIPMPPSHNALYKNILVQGKIRRAKAESFRAWQIEMRQWSLRRVPLLRDLRNTCQKALLEGNILHFHAEFFFIYRSIFTLEGKPKKNDTSNRIKALHDEISELIGVDDSYIFDGSFKKSLSSNEVETVTLKIDILPFKAE